MALSISAQGAKEEATSAPETEQQSLMADVYQDSAYQTLLPGTADITLTGAMPKDAAVKAYPVNPTVSDASVLTAYDITIFNADGSKFEPDGCQIEVKIEDSAVRGAIEANQSLEVFHMTGENAAPEQVAEVKTEDSCVAFAADSFSVYVVTTPETHFTHTYQFFDGNNEITEAKQILSTGEKLSEPAAPAKSGYALIGWYTAQTGGEPFTAWSTEGALTTNSVTRLYAQYAEATYVYYMSGSSDDSNVFYTQTYGDAYAEILSQDVPFNTGNVDMVLIGWSKSRNASVPDDTLALDGTDVRLYPVVAAAHWITYHTNGGTAVDPAYVLEDARTVRPANPTRLGYAFGGWYTNEACTQGFTFGAFLTANVNLHAKWTPQQTSYTVVYWQENADDSGYSYVEKMSRTGLTGSNATYGSKSYTGFQLNTAKTNAAATTIAGDGTTIRNVYYSRNIVTITFKNVYDTTIKTVTQKYDSDISAIWSDPTIVAQMNQGYVWKSSLSSHKYTFLQKMPLQDVTMQAFIVTR